MWISAAEHRNKRSVLVETYPSRSAALRNKGPPYNRLSQNWTAKRPRTKTSIWAAGDPDVCAVLPPKSAHRVAPAQIFPEFVRCFVRASEGRKRNQKYF